MQTPVVIWALWKQWLISALYRKNNKLFQLILLFPFSTLGTYLLLIPQERVSLKQGTYNFFWETAECETEFWWDWDEYNFFCCEALSEQLEEDGPQTLRVLVLKQIRGISWNRGYLLEWGCLLNRGANENRGAYWPKKIWGGVLIRRRVLNQVITVHHWSSSSLSTFSLKSITLMGGSVLNQTVWAQTERVTQLMIYKNWNKLWKD